MNWWQVWIATSLSLILVWFIMCIAVAMCFAGLLLTQYVWLTLTTS